MSKLQNWKNSIDPGFDETVRTLMSAIKMVRGLPNEGSLELTEAIYNIISQEDISLPLKITAAQLKDYPEIINPDILEILEIPSTRDKESFDKYFNFLLKMALQLPEESKQFYTKEIAYFMDTIDYSISIEEITDPVKLKEFEKFTKHTISIILSLFSRLAFIELDRIMKSDFNGDTKLLEDKLFIQLFLTSIDNFISQIAFKKTVTELLEKGDDGSLLKALRINKSLIAINPLASRIQRARITNDNEFLKNVASEFVSKPLQKESAHHETYIVLKLFWLAGLSSFKRETLYNFLKEDCGLIPPEFPNSFYSFIRRDILSDYTS